MGVLQGRRIPDSTWFERRSSGELERGDYGRELITAAGVERWDWFVRCPDGSPTVLWVNEDDPNGKRHVITEHEDGSITVGGSILGQIGWHGHLERGVWKD